MRAEEGAVDQAVRDIVLPLIEAGEYVRVKTFKPQHRANAIPNGASIESERYGHYVTIKVFPQMKYVAPPTEPPAAGTPLADAYNKLVEIKGEDTAKAILTAVRNVRLSTSSARASTSLHRPERVLVDEAGPLR